MNFYLYGFWDLIPKLDGRFHKTNLLSWYAFIILKNPQNNLVISAICFAKKKKPIAANNKWESTQLPLAIFKPVKCFSFYYFWMLAISAYLHTINKLGVKGLPCLNHMSFWFFIYEYFVVKRGDTRHHQRYPFRGETHLQQQFLYKELFYPDCKPCSYPFW